VATTKMPRPACGSKNRCAGEMPVNVFQAKPLVLSPKSKYRAQQSYRSHPLQHPYTRALHFSAGVEQKCLPSAKTSPPKIQRLRVPATDQARAGDFSFTDDASSTSGAIGNPVFAILCGD